MSERKRVLVSGEYSNSNSGFAIYTKHLCEQLGDKYEVAEFSSYCPINAHNDSSIRWKLYPNLPDNNDEREQEAYKQSTLHQFGMWRFEPVLLDGYWDYVLDMRDFSMQTHLVMSGLRDYYHLILSSCIDSHPLQEDWIQIADNADAFLSYSDYGGKVIKQEGISAKFNGTAYPGVEPEFRPLNQEQVRKEFDIPQDWLIVGTVMRNQRRKLFIDLIDCLKLLLEKTKDNNPNIYKNTYFYFHTPIIDLNPFNIIKYLRLYGLADRVLFTYVCQKCNGVFADFFKGENTICKHCKSHKAITPKVSFGATREQLNKIYNLFDAYVQYSMAEASGFGVQEAATAGVYPFGTNCTAISDGIRLTGGMPIKVQRNIYDIEVGSRRYLPSNEDFINKLIKFLSLPHQMRLRKGFECHQNARKHFNWEKNARVWIDAIEGLKDKPKKSWDEPFPNLQPNFNVPERLTNKQFVNWCIDNVLLDPKFKYTYTALNAIKNLDQGVISEAGKVKQFTRQDFFNYCKNRVRMRIHWEEVRCGHKIMPPQKFLEYSRIKEMLREYSDC